MVNDIYEMAEGMIFNQLQKKGSSQFECMYFMYTFIKYLYLL